MLDINLVAVVMQSVAFILLVLFMAKFAFGPIGAQIDTRQKEITDTLEQIAADRRAMEKTRADYEQRLAGIEAEAREHISGAVKQAQEEASSIITRSREEASTYKDKAISEIEQERRKAIAEIRSEMADLAVVAASKILEREINPAVHRELIGDFIQEVGTRN